jgi:GNAT superfamily N-acetyltransferase
MTGAVEIDVAARVSSGLAQAWERIAIAVGGAVERVDGLLLALTGIEDPQLNVALVQSAPRDAAAALAAAQAAFAARGHRIGIDLERGRYPQLEDAAADHGLVRAVTHPAMAIPVADVAGPAPPPGIDISRLRNDDALDDFWEIQASVFGMRRHVVRAYLGPATLRADGVAVFVARREGRAVSASVAVAVRESVGIFGVATLPDARHRGIGTAITAAAVEWARDRADLVWLQATDQGLRVYERMGFRIVADWDVWVLPP